MTPTRFNSEYEILNWLSKQENFAQGVHELRAASAEGRLEGGHGIVEKWLSVYDDVTSGRVVAGAPPPVPREAAAVVRDAYNEGLRRNDAFASHSMVQEAQLWAEAAREAAARADAAVARLSGTFSRASRWGKAGFWVAVSTALLLVLLAVLLWPTLDPLLNAPLRSMQRLLGR